MHEKFHWTAPNGTEIVVPYMDKIKVGVIRKARHLDDTDAVFTIIEAVCDEATLAAVDDLDSSELNDFAEAWQKAERLGESSGSSTSSTASTGEPSTTTSEPASPVSATA
jgi:hypothetical protein